MRLFETQDAEVTKVTVDKNDPDAVRVVFTGFPPSAEGLDTRHKDYKPSGELMPGEWGVAKPAIDGEVNFMWNFTSDRGFSMMVPPHDIKKEPNEERYPNLGKRSNKLADLMK